MVHRKLLRDAVLYFALSRLLLFALLVAGSQIAFLGKVYSGSVWETRIELQQERLIPELIRVTMVGDAWFYRDLMLNGYAAPGATTPNWAFFPLYPLIVQACRVTGEFALDAIIVSNVAFAAALVLLGRVLLLTGFAAADASRAMFYLAFFPTSYFFSLPMTESLFLALSLGAIHAALTERWWLAGILGGLCALTRAPGVLLLVPLALLFIERRERPRWRAAWLLLIPAGLGAFMWHLAARTGDPLAFVHVQQHWKRFAQPAWQPVWDFLRDPAILSTPWNPVILNIAAAILLILTSIAFARQRRWPFAAYALASLLLPMSTGSLQSLARYSLGVFPLFAFLAMLGRTDLADRIITGLSITLFGVLVAFLILRVDLALA